MENQFSGLKLESEDGNSDELNILYYERFSLTLIKGLLYAYIYHTVLYCAQSLQSCPTLCNPMSCSPPVSSVHETLQAVGEGERGMCWENSIEISILSRAKQITSPGGMHETSAWGWCTGKTQRDGMGREVGRRIGMGNTCKSMADSCQCMAKTTTIL